MSKLTRKEKERLEARREILTIAARLFAKDGFHKTTMDDIAIASEWSKGALYLRFQTKEELFFSIIEDIVNDYLETLNTSLTGHYNLEGLIKIIIEKQFTFFQDHIQFFQLFLSEQGKALQASGNRHREIMMAKQKEHFDLLVVAFDKVLSPDNSVSSNTIAIALTGAINNHLLNWLLNHKTVDLQQVQQEIVTLMLHGVQ